MKNCCTLLRIGKYIILIIAIIWFILIELFPAIKMPEIGWSGDEFIVEVETLKLINNIPNPPNENYIIFLGRYFPIAFDNKHGAMESYLMLPFLFFGGATLVALRIGHIFWGIIILILSYYFGYRFFNSVVGTLSVILLVVNASFLNSIRTGGQYGHTLPIFSLISLLFFFKWHNERKELYFNLGVFF